MITMKRIGATSYIMTINGRKVNVDRYFGDADLHFHIKIIKPLKKIDNL